MRTAVDSDSEDDSDYVPPKEDGSDTEGRAPKRARTHAQQSQSPSVAMSAIDTSEGGKTGEDAYAAFKASLTAPPSESAVASASASSQAPAAPATVKIVKRYRYAGEETTEVAEVPADSEEARKWPRWQPDDTALALAAKDLGPLPGPSPSESSGTTASAAAESSPAPAVATTPAKRPGPRKGKGRGKLADIDIPAKKEPVKRLTTLDKSAMDWRAHVQGEPSAGIKDELDANRRGGGYLEKVEFLQRVEARKEEVLDANKGKRRR